jgi:hypothetical protein
MTDQWPGLSEEELEWQREVTAGVIGLPLRGVRYVTLDYARFAQDLAWAGQREIASQVEWQQPSWSFGRCDSADFGIDLEFDSAIICSVGWESPGYREGLELRRTSIVEALDEKEAAVAVWDVTSRSRWEVVIGRRLEAFDLQYSPWQPGVSVWLPGLALTFEGGCRGEVVLGECDRSGDGRIGPSANNLAIRFNA